MSTQPDDSGVFDAAVKAVEAVDACLKRVLEAVQAVGAEMIITADHGNLESMFDERLAAEKARCLELLEQFASLQLAGPLAHNWPEHIAAGKLTGEQYSRLQHKHVAHHLTQFSA